jgi:hypothetical protein
MRGHHHFSRLLCLAFVMLLLFPGCGKKGDPIPRFRLKAITDLAVVDYREGVLLSWSFPATREKIGAFKILRSKPVPANEFCPSCPKYYKPYKTVSIADENLRREGEMKGSYIDWEIKVGDYCAYQVIACDPEGHCGMESNAAGLVHTTIGKSLYELPVKGK